MRLPRRRFVALLRNKEFKILLPRIFTNWFKNPREFAKFAADGLVSFALNSDLFAVVLLAMTNNG